MTVTSSPKSKNIWLLLITALFATLAGLGAFTFYYGEGFSYFSKDPAACANCHIMQPQFDSWQKASHHTVATCVDCHLPHEFIPKMIAKTENGFWHSKGFTLQDFPEPIFIRKHNADILKNNCLHCHADFTHNITSVSPSDIETFSCLHCHRSVGHGETVGMGKYEPIDTLISHQTRDKHESK